MTSIKATRGKAGPEAAPQTGSPPAMKVWYMTTGEAGFRTQARGLALALSDDPREFVVDLRIPWRGLPGRWVPFPMAGMTKDSDRLSPPWPDVLISCGRRAAALAIAVRRLSRGSTVTVHVQNPLTDVSAFDLVAPMVHDHVAGANVLSVSTALHDLTPERLAEAADRWRDRLTAPGQPLIGVMLGGATRHHPFSAAETAALMDHLRGVKAKTGARLAITPSRRTPVVVRALVEDALLGDPDVFIWSMEGDNPYRGILALSDRLVVTTDSVSMISEALSTGRPVEVFGHDGGRRHAEFLKGILAQGLVRRFEGDPEPAPARAPINATETVAEAVRKLVQARTAASG